MRRATLIESIPAKGRPSHVLGLVREVTCDEVEALRAAGYRCTTMNVECPSDVTRWADNAYHNTLANPE